MPPFAGAGRGFKTTYDPSVKAEFTRSPSSARSVVACGPRSGGARGGVATRPKLCDATVRGRGVGHKVVIRRLKGTGLLAGRDGWLFWIGTSRQNLGLYRDGPLSRVLLWRWRNLVLARRSKVAALGARYLQLVVPDKLSVYDNKLVGRELDPDMAIGRRLGREVERSGGADAWIDLFSRLRAEREESELYLRTDTHFTPAGYRLAYGTLCAACGATALPRLLQGGSEEAEIETDLGSKLVPPSRERCEKEGFEIAAERVDANALVRHREDQLRHVAGISSGSRVVYRNERSGTDPRRLALFGDSYTFHSTGLGPMLAETFREVHLLWSSPLDFGYVERVKPDLVIHEIAERFLRRVPRDGVDVDALAEERLRTALAEARRSAAS